MDKIKVLIIDDVHSLLTNGLTNLGFEVHYKPDATRLDVLNSIKHYDGLVVRTKTNIDAEILEKAPNLKFIARAGAGLDNIDILTANKQNIAVFNAGEANADAVAEQAMAMLLSLFANVVKANTEVVQKKWDREGNRGIELSGKTVGIIGYGNTGKAFAKKLQGFNVKVLAYDKYLKGYGSNNIIEASMEDIFNQADVLSLHIPLTTETNKLINLNYIQQFKKNIWLLNLSRGNVVNTTDLTALLKTGKIKGAALDVLENEKLSSLNQQQETDFNYLCKATNVILTPHIGGWTKESYEKISEVLLYKIRELKLNMSVS